MRNRQISKLVERINNQIKEKKGKLAPLIKELRQVRTDFSQLESEYNEKKSLYESTGDFLKVSSDRRRSSPHLCCCAAEPALHRLCLTCVPCPSRSCHRPWPLASRPGEKSC